MKLQTVRIIALVSLIIHVLAANVEITLFEDGSGNVNGIEYCLPSAICNINNIAAEVDSSALSDSEYECQMLLAETSDMQPEDIIEACQP